MVELIVVFGIIALLATVVVFAFSNFSRYFALRTAAQDVQVSLIYARNATLAADLRTVHGVHIDSNRIIEFVGPTYDSASSTNIIHEFPDTVTATYAITGGGSDIVFTRLSGTTQQSGTITITESVSGASSTLRVYASGLVE